MRTPLKLAAFGGALLMTFGGALGVGAAVGSPLPEQASAEDHDRMAGKDDTTSMEDDGTVDAGVADLPGGLMVSDRGLTLDLADDSLPAEFGTPVAFRVLGADGVPVTDYEVSHDKDMHLIVVQRDMTGFQHVHPKLDADGTWIAPVDLTAGQWRVFADFVPGQGEASGEAMKLGADLSVAGDYQPAPLPEPSSAAEVDGYSVALDGELVPGAESELTLSVSRDGQPVTDLQPYLAAYGHLVALRDGDLAYLHVHPAGSPDDGVTQPGPDITFYTTAPSVGDYRLFLDFQHDDEVRTAEFTVRADGTLSPAADPRPPGTTPSTGPTAATTTTDHRPAAGLTPAPAFVSALHDRHDRHRSEEDR